MSDRYEEFSQRASIPEPQRTYVVLARQGKNLWNHWIGGRMDKYEKASLAKELGLSTLPIPNSLTSSFRETLHDLFGKNSPATEAIQLWSLGHTFFSVVMFFLIGLALRNHFKIN